MRSSLRGVIDSKKPVLASGTMSGCPLLERSPARSSWFRSSSPRAVAVRAAEARVAVEPAAELRAAPAAAPRLAPVAAPRPARVAALRPARVAALRLAPAAAARQARAAALR